MNKAEQESVNSEQALGWNWSNIVSLLKSTIGKCSDEEPHQAISQNLWQAVHMIYELREQAIFLAAAQLGKLGGASKSTAKAAAARKNGKLGGRPKSEHTFHDDPQAFELAKQNQSDDQRVQCMKCGHIFAHEKPCPKCGSMNIHYKVYSAWRQD